jgi:hypothetical protein
VSAKTGGATGRFMVVVVTDRKAGVIGIAPLYEENLLGASTFGTTLQPFGRSNAIETMTDEPIAIFRRGYEDRAVRMVTSYIAAESPLQGWDVAVAYGTRRTKAASGASISLSRRLGSVEVTRVRNLALTMDLPTSWSALQGRLSKSMRDNLAYYPRRLTREIGAWQLKAARSPAEVSVATENLIQLHLARSAATTLLAHGNHLPGETQVSFLRGLFQRLATRNEISIVSLEVAGETVAVQAFMEAGRCVSVYYSGFAERWSRYSPLTIITAAMIQRAIERGFERVEFPPLDKQWKSRWGALNEALVEEKSIYSLSFRSLFRGLTRRLSERHPHRIKEPAAEMAPALLGGSPQPERTI